MASITITVNDKAYTLGLNPQMSLLWALRDVLGLTGTKYSCGIGVCGSCTVHVEGRAQRSCITPLSAIEGKHITTIEGLSPDGNHPLQKAWVEAQVSQCGYCQPGQIMAAAAFLAEHPRPSEDEIVQEMSRNLCRCGSYQRILKAVQKVAEGGAA